MKECTRGNASGEKNEESHVGVCHPPPCSWTRWTTLSFSKPSPSLSFPPYVTHSLSTSLLSISDHPPPPSLSS